MSWKKMNDDILKRLKKGKNGESPSRTIPTSHNSLDTFKKWYNKGRPPAMTKKEIDAIRKNKK